MFTRKEGLKPFEKKVYLASPTMHGEELKYMKEAYDILLSYESTEYMDDETIACVSKLLAIMLDYSSYSAKVASAVSKVIGN